MARVPFDVVIAGGGPAGAVAALVLCRAGARVAVFDRARFPRHKLCGDTVNPGTLSILRRLGVAGAAGTHAIRGMVVTGARGVSVEGRYPNGVTGRAVLRRDFDHALLLAASAAGARIEEEALVRGPASTGATIDGLYVSSRTGATLRVRAPVVIAADGRQSRVARSLRLAWHPHAPRRWAVGAYFQDVSGLTACGEMHIRGHEYIGVAPLPGGLTNACIVTAERAALRDPYRLLRDALRNEPALRERFAQARLAERPAVLGPLAVECGRVGVTGLLLAGDAAGFIDPMTGDGLHFAVRGAELAAEEALRALEHGFLDAHGRLQAARRREFGGKWRFNRALRALAGSPAAVRVAGALAGWVPAGVERAILYAGDVRAPRPT